MAKKASAARQKTGLYHAREARGMDRTELVRLSGISKQQLSRLENGHIRLRLDHLKPFAPHLGYTPEQMLLWGRYPGTGDGEVKAADARQKGRATLDDARCSIPEIDTRAEPAGRGAAKATRKTGRHTDPIKPEHWGFPPSFVREQLHASVEQLVVIEVNGDSMAPTIMSGDHVVVNTGHTAPTPDGLYAIRDTLKHIAVKRLQLMRSTRPPRVKIISANPNHATEEVPVTELEIVGKVVCFVRLF
jgi:transcriptional regulator with XRE-family HTH domain